jgi:Mg2+ and Co2+ transporter CorA
MATISDYKRRRYGILADLVEKTSRHSVFYTYRNKREVGLEIFKELYARFHNVEGEPRGFYMDDSKTIGILSQCQSLQALLLLASDFELGFDETNLISEKVENVSIRDIMDYVIEDVINRIKTDDPHKFKFDASPYDTQKYFNVEYSNVEAITWVIPCFLQALKYHAENKETCKWEAELVEIVSYGIKYLNKSFIPSENVGKSNKLEIGWNFTADCEEPSLYYSYTVCECYVSIFETFKEYLNYHVAVRNGTLTEEMQEDYQKHIEEYEKRLSKPMPGLNEKQKQIARFDAYNELRLRYCEINERVEAIDDSLFGQFEENCKMVAREVWRLTKEHLAEQFFYNNLNTTLTEEDISIATTSDALFNTVYIINIMLDAGLDNELMLKRDMATGIEADEAERDYNNLFEACQLASQKAFRAYEKLKTQGKEYIVEQFLVGFNENFVKHKEMVKELRKLRMRVFTLMPLLIRTNNVISEYLIKYPQVNMRKYLGYILENRYTEESANGALEYKWIWENDGYFSCSNYYYILALGEFYKYYKEYEQKYIERFNENEKRRNDIISEQMKVLTAPGGTIDNLRNQIEQKNDEIEALKAKLESVETPVEDAVAAVVKKEMEKMLPSMLSSFLTSASLGLIADEVEPSPATVEHKEFADALKTFLFATLSEQIYDKASEGLTSKDDILEVYTRINNSINKVLKLFVKKLVADAKNRTSITSSPLLAMFEGTGEIK